jgi:hypothetical protein
VGLGLWSAEEVIHGTFEDVHNGSDCRPGDVEDAAKELLEAHPGERLKCVHQPGVFQRDLARRMGFDAPSPASKPGCPTPAGGGHLAAMRSAARSAMA